MSLAEAPHNQSIETITASLNVTTERGLEIEEAAERIEKYGRNAIEGSTRTSFLKKFFNQFLLGHTFSLSK